MRRTITESLLILLDKIELVTDDRRKRKHFIPPGEDGSASSGAPIMEPR